MSRSVRPAYGGQSPNQVSPKEKISIKTKEANLAKGPSRFVYSSFLKLQCPNCGRVLKANKSSKTKDWITLCSAYHCWRVWLLGDSPNLESIAYHDDRYPKRKVR